VRHEDVVARVLCQRVPSEQRHHAKTRRFSLSIPRHENEKAFPRKMRIERAFFGRGPGRFRTPRAVKSGRRRPSTAMTPEIDHPRVDPGLDVALALLSMTSGSRAAENPGTTRVCEKDPKKRWRGRRARSACLAGRVGFSGSTKIK
jgi:hypothetical protein